MNVEIICALYPEANRDQDIDDRSKVNPSMQPSLSNLALQMPLPALLHLRPWLRRYTRLSPPSSPRTERGGPAIGNLEDAVGALERWWIQERERTAAGGWRGWVSRAPLLSELGRSV